VNVSEIAPEFQKAIADLDSGQICKPFQTPFGWHLLKLLDRIKSRKLNLNDDWQTIETVALNMKRERLFNEWVQTLKQDHYIWPAQK